MMQPTQLQWGPPPTAPMPQNYPQLQGEPEDYKIKSSKAWLFLAGCVVIATTIAIVIATSL